MPDRELAAGENAPLPADWRLTVTPSMPLVMIRLDAADRLVDEPIPVAAEALPMNLGALDSGVQRCLLVAAGRDLPAADVELDLGGTRLVFRAGPAGSALAAVLVEFYRRAGDWKVRALGQRYAGGLPELGRAHGTILADPADAGARPAGSAAGSTDPGGAGDDAGNPERIMRHLNGIWEDASRSLVAFAESMAFADERRDNELGALVADPTARDADHPGRAAAEQRHRQIADTATDRRLKDLDQLIAELAGLEQTFPAPVARWDAAVWQQPIGPAGAGIFRIGTLTRPDSQALRIPMVHGVSSLGGICLENPAGIVEESIVGLLHRALSAVPAGSGALVIADDDQLAGALGVPAAARNPDRSPLLELARQVDLHQMAAEAGATAELTDRLPGVVVVPWPGLGFGPDEVAALDRIGTQGALLGVRLIYLASRQQLGQVGLREQPRYLPVVAATVSDPWTGLRWDFEPDDGTVDAGVARRIRERAVRAG